MKMLAIIPARSGSKGLPGKNTKPLLGKPLIVYTIEAALQSKYIEQSLVTTDNPDIQSLAKQHGAEAPFLRPAVLSNDNASMIHVIAHALQQFEHLNQTAPEFIILLQPTCPLRDHIHIDKAIELFLQQNKKRIVPSLVSICEVKEHPYYMKKVVSGRLMDYADHEKIERRQELPKLYRLNGSIYIVNTQLFKAYQRLHYKHTIPYLMSADDSIDIDDALDFSIAELLLQKRQNNHQGVAKYE